MQIESCKGASALKSVLKVCTRHASSVPDTVIEVWPINQFGVCTIVSVVQLLDKLSAVKITCMPHTDKPEMNEC